MLRPAGGVAPRVSSFHPLRNVAASETRYNADPKELVEAWRSAPRAEVAQILAIYHSHPRWEAVPSTTDLKQNLLGRDAPDHRLLARRSLPDVRVWRLDPDSFQELPWKLVEPDGDSRGVASQLSAGLN